MAKSAAAAERSDDLGLQNEPASRLLDRVLEYRGTTAEMTRRAQLFVDGIKARVSPEADVKLGPSYSCYFIDDGRSVQVRCIAKLSGGDLQVLEQAGYRMMMGTSYLDDLKWVYFNVPTAKFDGMSGVNFLQEGVAEQTDDVLMGDGEGI